MSQQGLSSWKRGPLHAENGGTFTISEIDDQLPQITTGLGGGTMYLGLGDMLLDSDDELDNTPFPDVSTMFFEL
jgi:hypothetical protein